MGGLPGWVQWIMVGVVGLSPMLTSWLVSVIRALLKGDECNRSGENAGDDADRALDPEPDEGKRRKELGGVRGAAMARCRVKCRCPRPCRSPIRDGDVVSVPEDRHCPELLVPGDLIRVEQRPR